MGWSLGQLRDLDIDEYFELIAWAQDKGQDPDSKDMDKFLEAKNAKPEAEEVE
jgi:hypothetical protein